MLSEETVIDMSCSLAKRRNGLDKFRRSRRFSRKRQQVCRILIFVILSRAISIEKRRTVTVSRIVIYHPCNNVAPSHHPRCSHSLRILNTHAAPTLFPFRHHAPQPATGSYGYMYLAHSAGTATILECVWTILYECSDRGGRGGNRSNTNESKSRLGVRGVGTSVQRTERTVQRWYHAITRAVSAAMENTVI